MSRRVKTACVRRANAYPATLLALLLFWVFWITFWFVTRAFS